MFTLTNNRLEKKMKTALIVLLACMMTVLTCSDSGLRTESGISYEILREGAGSMPQPGDVVAVHYTGTLLNGKKFGSSYDTGGPFVFMAGVGNVIKGWDEIVLMMTVGSKWRVTIPSELAYGGKTTDSIPPNSDLIIDIELLGINTEEITTESGIRYTVIEKGAGPIPKRGQNVTVHYNVWLPDWRKLDSSFYRGTPYSLVLGKTGVIRGWHEILSLMPVGSRWKIKIPSKLAYGEKGRQGVPPNTDLTFEIKLLSVK